MIPSTAGPVLVDPNASGARRGDFPPPPPEPYAQLLPGDEVQAGDIRWQRGELGWKPVGEELIGTEATSGERVFARLFPPEGYRMLADGEPTRDRDLVWAVRFGQWLPIEGHHQYDGEFVCRPTFEPADCRSLSIPPHHRELATDEVVHRGDKFAHVASDGWIKVPEGLRGTQVPEHSEANGWVRYCRPTDPNATTWYVDLRPGKGRPDALGGVEDPFDELDSAIEAIEEAARTRKSPVYGVVREIRGVPLFAYDLPEPEPGREPVVRPPEIAGDPVETRPIGKLELPEEQKDTEAWLVDRIDELEIAMRSLTDVVTQLIAVVGEEALKRVKRKPGRPKGSRNKRAEGE